MASLLTDPLYETSGRGPPPIKDYYHFFVTKSEIIWRWWKISPRMVDRHSKPGEVKESLSDFLEDTDLQREVRVVFGDHVLEFTMALCEGHYNYLDRLSDSLLLRIINFLELEDVLQLGWTSRKFQQLCGSEEFWEQAMRRRCCSISDEVASLAKEMGWRTVFFTNKLHLQKLLSRRRQMTEEQQEDPGTDEVTQSQESSSESSKEEIISGAGADPDFDNIDPHLDSTEPQVGNIDPVTGSTEPHIDNIHPHVDNIEPPIDSPEPHIDNIDPHVDNIEPPIDSPEPHIDNIDPHVDDHNATSGSEVGV